MSIFYAYLSFNNDVKDNWSRETTLTNILATSFQNLTISEERMMSTTAFNIVRDQLRDYLSSLDPNNFPRYGTLGAPAEHIFDFIKNQQNSKLVISFSCSSTRPCTPFIIIPTNDYIPSIFFSSLWTTWSNLTHSSRRPQKADTQQWIDLAFEAKKNQNHHHHRDKIRHASVCTTSAITNSHICLNGSPPLLTFEIVPETLPQHVPSRELNITEALNNSKTLYRLHSIIYHGDYHFTSRLFSYTNNSIWTYDGQKNNGFPQLESSSDYSNSQTLMTLDGRSAHIYVYGLST